MRTAEIALIYNDYIDEPPVAPAQLFSQACSNDSVTIESWRETWIKNAKANKEFLGSFAEHSVGQLFGKHKYGVAVCAGSGPSLGINGKELLNKGDVPLISCLHNFHFFEDLGIDVDYYVSLDAGPVVIEEVSEGGKLSEDEYWEKTKDKTLVAFVSSHPDLLKKWKGKVYVYNAPVPDQAYQDAMEKIEPFHVNIGNGGNVLGACVYFAKAILGVHRVGMVGADFCFDNKTHQKFHSWDSKYDQKRGHVIPHHDVFGNKVFTWPSYRNFKNWFEYLALSVPDNNPETKFYSNWMVNCSEGGTLGSYAHGNLRAITQMPLGMFLNELNMSDVVKESIDAPEHNTRRLLF